MARTVIGTLRTVIAASISLLLLVAALVAGASSASASPAPSEEQDLANTTNGYRASQGLGRLAIDSGMSSVARAWSEHMAATGVLAHNPSAGAQVDRASRPWNRLAENVGTGSTIPSIQNAFVSSPGHRANLVGNYTRAGVGAARDGRGRLWVTVIFADGQPLATVAPAPVQMKGVAAEGRDNGRFDVAQSTDDGSVQVRTEASGRWSGWTGIGGGTRYDPTLTSWGGDRLDVFVTGTDGALWQRTLAGWQSLGGRLASAPTATSWGNGRIDVFARGTDGAIWSRYYSGGSWSGWYSLGGQISGAPEVTSWGPGRLDVFAAGTDGQVWHRASQSLAWGRWEALGGKLTSSPGAVSAKSGNVQVFARGADNAVWTRSWNGRSWTAWSSLGGSVFAAPEAAPRGGGQVSLIGRGADGQLWERTSNGSGWGGWSKLA